MKFTRCIAGIGLIALVGPIIVNAQYVDVIVVKGGSGLGVVRDDTYAIDCGETCEGVFEDGEEITLTATASAGSVFVGWKDACSGSQTTCQVIMDDNKIITAVFEKERGADYDSPPFDDWPDDSKAFNFINRVVKVVKKPKKQWWGYSPLPPPLSIFKKKFNPTSFLGAKWKINMANPTEPVAQGSLVGRGSYINIAVGLYTGTVRGVFNGKESWNVLYANRQGAQIAELFWKGGGYQREMVQDGEGNPYQTAMFVEGQTLFAVTPEGELFAVKPGMFPEISKRSATRIVVPQNGPLIPVDKILQLLSEKVISVFINIFSPRSFAAAKSLGEQVAGYWKIMDQITALQQSFSQISFDDLNMDFDFDYLQNLFNRFEAAEKSLNAAAFAMGHLRMLVRDADWFAAESLVTRALMDQGVAPTIAALIAQGAPPFDFYAIQGDAKKKNVIAGLCRPEKDAKGNQGMACVTRKMAPAEAQLIRARADESLRALIVADEKAVGIEQSFFGS